MKRHSIFAFIALSLSLLIPASGRFVYGIVLVLEMNLLLLFNCLFVLLIKKFKLEKIASILQLAFLFSITILYRQIMIILQPELVLTIGFIMYLCPISSFLLSYIFNSSELPLLEQLKYTMKNSSYYSIYALVFFLFRDLFGFGTFTFFGSNHMIFEKVIFNSDHLRLFSIFASIPGAFMLSAIILFVNVIIRNRLLILRKVEVK